MSEGDPFKAQIECVSELLSEEHYKVANFFSKKQVKNFAQILAITHLYKAYLLRDERKKTWLDIFAEELMRMNKAIDGKSVKLASQVAQGANIRSVFNLQRFRRLMTGREKEEW